jgi:hypothetical protein
LFVCSAKKLLDAQCVQFCDCFIDVLSDFLATLEPTMSVPVLVKQVQVRQQCCCQCLAVAELAILAWHLDLWKAGTYSLSQSGFSYKQIYSQHNKPMDERSRGNANIITTETSIMIIIGFFNNDPI